MDKFAGTTKELERYLGAAYSDSCQPDIMTKTPETFPDPDMPTIIPDMGVERPKTDADMTNPKNKNIDDDVYGTDMLKI